MQAIKLTPYFIIILALTMLTACVNIHGNDQVKTGPALYDFGLSADSTLTLETALSIEPINAVDALNNNRIRYRLNYQNPAQVFTYNESRWVSPPAQMLNHVVRTQVMTKTGRTQNCGLKLQIESFDHVLTSPTESQGIVQISAMLVVKKTRQVISNTLINQTSPATSTDAKGGSAALQTASYNALQKALDWGNTMVANATECQ